MNSHDSRFIPMASPVASEQAASGQARAALRPLDDVLAQLADVLCGVTDEQYTRKPVAGFESSLGAHLRHCLDHVRELLMAVATGQANFDARHRDTLVQASRSEGLAEITRLRRNIAVMPASEFSTPIQLKVMLTCDGEPVDVTTSFGREIAFVLSHTLHHNAVIGAMVKALGGPLPARFGYAPSTLRALQAADATCAQ